MEEEAEQQVGGGDEEGEAETDEINREIQERRIPNHLHRRDHVHQVGPTEDGILLAPTEP